MLVSHREDLDQFQSLVLWPDCFYEKLKEKNIMKLGGQ